MVVFLLVVVISLLAVIVAFVSIIKRDDERAELIIQKSSINTLGIMFGYLFFCVIEQAYYGFQKIDSRGINPFIELSILSVVFLIELVYFRKKYGA